MNRPEVHDVLRRWRALADADDPRAILVGETYVLDLDGLMPYYGNGEDELNLAFNFLFVHADLDADELRTIVAGVEEKLPQGAWPVYTGSNHDAGRFTTRWAGDDPRRARLALLMLLTLRGTPFLYYGDELGLPEVRDGLADGARPGRAAHRRPDAQPRPLPHADAVERGARRRLHRPRRRRRGCRSATSRRTTSPPRPPTAASTLHLTRDLIALRREEPALRTGAYAALETPAGVWAWRRGDAFAVGAQPRRTTPSRSPGSTARRDRHGPRRATARPSAARSRSGRGRAALVRLVMSALEPLLSDEGWAYASLPPAGAGRPGPLPRALRPRLADHGAPGAARRRRRSRAPRCARSPRARAA